MHDARQEDDFFLGQIEYADLPLAYEITRTNDGEATITRRSIDQLVCAEVDTVTLLPQLWCIWISMAKWSKTPQWGTNITAASSNYSATNTQDDLSLITSNNGFGYRSDDQSAFSRQFKQTTGLTPKAYRERREA